jgi:hypothetical protein
MTRRYFRINIAEMCIQQLVLCGMITIPMAAIAAQEEPIMMDEILTVVIKGKAHKSSGQDGICHEFYRMMREIIIQDLLHVTNHMHKHGSEEEKKKSGPLVFLPKKTDPGGPDDYRPLILLNAYHKPLTRIIENRLQPWMSDILQTSQRSGRHGKKIFEAVAALRDNVAYTELYNESVCRLTTDFN